MLLKEYFSEVCDALSTVYPADEARAMAYILFDKLLRISKKEILLDGESLVAETLENVLKELLAHRPLQYVLGETECCNCTFRVDENVLIPRPETEELIHRIIADWQGTTPRILDIGTGSGVIAISLAQGLPGSQVTALDVSPEALVIAQENAERNGVDVSFIQTDILIDAPAGRFDVIVSNPPYVCESERARMRPNVLEYEPAQALFVPDNDPLLFYRRIAALGQELLEPGGTLYFEINEVFSAPTAALLNEYNDVEVIQDMFGKDRMIKGLWR